jgi:ComF family protein
VCNAPGTYLQHIKHNMSVIDRFLAVLTPYECLGCDAEGGLLCTGCIQELTVLPERCHHCLRPSAAWLTCAPCSTMSSLSRLRAGTAYRGLAKDLVWKLKSAGARSTAAIMADRLRLLLPAGSPAIMPVPTASGRVRSRGYDQARLLARELARRNRLPYLDVLVRSGQTHQVGASRAQRLEQLGGAFRLVRPASVRGRHVVLIDDVVTTGATLETAGRLLKEHGAARVEALVFAQA